MSVLIKDMEMPKKCGECNIYVRYRTWNGDLGDEFCGMTKENVSYKTKPDWCPLSEVSERKTGKWYKPTGMMPPEYIGVYRCDQCDEIATRDWKSHRQILSNFCPNCGNPMESGGQK